MANDDEVNIMSTLPSDPPPPQMPRDEGKRTPKKAWAKPTFRRVTDGVIVTESGATPTTVEDTFQYSLQS